MGRQIVNGLLTASVLLGLVTIANAGEFDKFKELAQETIKQVNGGKVSDVDKLIKMQEEMIAIGTAACQEYAAKRPDDAKMLNLVATNAAHMKGMTLTEIEAQWHEKAFLKNEGIAAAQLEEKSITGSLMDTVVHPATTFIALNEYKKTQNKQLLTQVNNELDEVLHHIEHIK